MMTIRIKNKKHYSGPGEYVGRPSILGNPFPVKDRRDEAISKYKEWLRNAWKNEPYVRMELERLAEKYRLLGELTLICWCSPLQCHADFLAEAIRKLK